MAAYPAVTRRELLAHRDGAKAFSGTTLTDPDVVRRQEATFGRLTRHGFTVEQAARGLLPLHHFTVGACVEEQAAMQADERYRPGRRAEFVGPDAPLTVQAGAVLFSDVEERFRELVSMLLDTIAAMVAEDSTR
jgi:TetR/AcrR family transcriptional regulator, tetracycline repressor protein